MSEKDDPLREMAAHRGLKLVKSRRRKAGGDFGLYGLRDATGAPVFGIDADRLTATSAEIEDYLRGAVRATWGKSAGSVKARPKPKPAPVPKPKPRPRFKVTVENLLAKLPAAKRAEAFTELLARPGIRVERIVSRGQATPEDAPMVQESEEWVLLLEGAAGLRIEDSDEVRLGPGDHVRIAAGQRHWVTWTAKDRATVWLAVHLG
jgi:mannose-6-phosphate isomerase-like protein (cupin superfamily)